MQNCIHSGNSNSGTDANLHLPLFTPASKLFFCKTRAKVVKAYYCIRSNWPWLNLTEETSEWLPADTKFLIEYMDGIPSDDSDVFFQTFK